jgi:hypothetical protein
MMLVTFCNKLASLDLITVVFTRGSDIANERGMGSY